MTRTDPCWCELHGRLSNRCTCGFCSSATLYTASGRDCVACCKLVAPCLGVSNEPVRRRGASEWAWRVRDLAALTHHIYVGPMMHWIQHLQHAKSDVPAGHIPIHANKRDHPYLNTITTTRQAEQSAANSLSLSVWFIALILALPVRCVSSLC